MSNITSGIGLPGILTVVFVVLKLCGVIKWSWWWVVAPLWGPLGLLILVMGVLFIGAVFLDWKWFDK